VLIFSPLVTFQSPDILLQNRKPLSPRHGTNQRFQDTIMGSSGQMDLFMMVSFSGSLLIWQIAFYLPFIRTLVFHTLE
jgi:hypothetical protein